MNKIKIMAISYVVLITLIIIFPPVQYFTSKVTVSRGFSAIWMIPRGLSINITFLLIELFALTAIYSVIYFFVVKEK